MNTLLDGQDTKAEFSIGRAADRNAVPTDQSFVNPDLTTRDSDLLVTFSCVFCRPGVQKKQIHYSNAEQRSTSALFGFSPKIDLTRDRKGEGNVIFQVTGADGILYDNVVVPVLVESAAAKVSPATAAVIPTRTRGRINISRPPGSSEVDLTITCGADEKNEKLLISLLPSEPKLVSLFAGRHLGPDGSPAMFRTNLEVSKLAKVVARDYATLNSVVLQNAGLQLALTGDSSAVAKLSTSNNALSPADETALLKTFHHAGLELYGELFLRKVDPKLKSLMQIVESYRPASRRLRLRIEVSSGIYVPWQILHPVVAMDKGKFWGFRYDLIEDPQGMQPAGYYPASLSYSVGPMVFGKYRADVADSDSDKDIANLGDDQFAFLTTNLKLRGAVKADSLAAFRKAMIDNRDSLRMIVAYTHGENGTQFRRLPTGDFAVDEIVAGPKLRFAKSEFFPAMDLDGLPWQPDVLDENFSFKQRPFVFLNGCETSGGGYFATQSLSFPNIFLHLGARGVIATAAPVWPMFGYFFGESLLQRISTGQNAPAALTDARLEFLQTFNNPLGLLYAYYGGADAAVTLH